MKDNFYLNASCLHFVVVKVKSSDGIVHRVLELSSVNTFLIIVFHLRLGVH